MSGSQKSCKILISFHADAMPASTYELYIQAEKKGMWGHSLIRGGPLYHQVEWLGQVTGETQAAGDAGHDSGDEVVEVAKGGCGELEGAEANVVQGLIVQHHALVCVLHKLVH